MERTRFARFAPQPPLSSFFPSFFPLGGIGKRQRFIHLDTQPSWLASKGESIKDTSSYQTLCT